MFRPVKHKYFTRDSLCRNQVWVLRHVSRTIDLSWVVDALNDLYMRLAREDVASQLAALVIVVSAVELFR